MAARLVQRLSRLLVASPSFQASSSSIPSECIRACQSAPPRASPLHASALCRHTDSLPALKQKVNGQTEKDFQSLIQSMSSAEELLQISSEYSRSGNRAAAIISQIAKVTETNKAEVVNDRRFAELLSAVNRQIQTIWNARLVSLLRSLYVLHVDGKNHFLRSVETEVRWRLRKFSMELQGRLARVIVPYAQTEEQKELVLDLAKSVELRWTEVKDTKTLVNVIYSLSQVSKTLLERMEDKVLEYAELLTPLESRTITMALAAQNCRSLPILRALSFHLVQRNKELCPLVIVDLAYAYAKLNFSQHQVLQKMASDLLPKVPELSSKEMTGCIRSFSTLRFFNLPLCEAIAQACLERSSSFTPTQLSSVILSFAHLNFLPSQQEEFFSMVVQRLSEELGSLSPSMLVDLVWSLCVLQLVTPAFLQKALDPQIYKLFMGDVSKKSSNYSLKLTQINATAQLECPEYRGPLLPLSLLSADGGSSLSPLQNDVRNVLRDVFPDKDTCSFNIKTVYGHHIDAEFVLDSENNPLALRNFEDTHVLHSSGTDALPEGARRFALKSWEFSNYCLRTKELTGWFALCRRHLRAAGFLVVEVPFYEWQELKSEWQKSAFLKNQIKKVVAEQMSM
ncbi:FAST kinase domain-containing protein 4 isoform X1 [Bufo gargarizans]|uniref:FAST kinase domain-containing protein 4 isoform X1 n=1 Tax=Bufo gargarizans TaxID=30331 RepID=UPI001CF1E071|nr:FAST kinase domain-containing protein 4 isoform X1 [Bufo gargarizans]XP_044149675.1 FAST kinase domain-containing protein 4 isoform X1 [Bufo gargarizans]